MGRPSESFHSQFHTDSTLSKSNNIDYRTSLKMIPFLILGNINFPAPRLLILAAGLAIANHFMFRYFDQRPTQESISQGWITAISVALAFLFKTCITSALLVAFNQQLWLTFRQRSLKSIHINTLFSIPTSLYSLLDIRILPLAPITWTIALICWLIPVATIFPPASLSVVGVLRHSSLDVLVPTFNASTNTSTLIGWDSNAADCYAGAGQDLLRLTTLTLLSGNVLPFNSPCGPNCTYGLSFRGPAFQCRNSTSDPDNPHINDGGSGSWLETNIIDNVYWLWYYNVKTDPPNPEFFGRLQAVSCRTYEAQYNLSIRFSNSQLSFDEISVTTQNLWKGVNSSPEASCVESYQSHPSGPFWDDLNLGAISSSVSKLLDGNITYSIGMGHSIGSVTSLIGMTSMATLNNSNGILLHLPLEPKLEAYMINATLTVAGAGYSSEYQKAEVQSWDTIYVYTSPIRLYLSYGLSWLFAIISVLLGYSALIRNGFWGDRGFMQLLMTTRNRELDALIGGNNWTSPGNVPILLKDAKFRYGRSLYGTKVYFGTDSTVTTYKR